MTFTSIIDLAYICARSGITEAILSPGSRSAPIALALIRQPEIHCRTIPDERSAAFMALGMAQQLDKPVVLACTSGSAALNYAPAVAEAYFQEVPLLILTADRPPEWIDQWDGQTIRQENIYGRHAKGSYQLPDTGDHPDIAWHAQRIIQEAIVQSMTFPKGPVHINIPIREPFYPGPETSFLPSSPNLQAWDILPDFNILKEDTWLSINNQLEKYSKLMIIPGQQKPDKEVRRLLKMLAKNKKAVVVTDAISNMVNDQSIVHHDFIIPNLNVPSDLEPDLIITFGKSVLSKPLKQFLRKSKASHWQLQHRDHVSDTYQKLSKIIPVDPTYFLEYLMENRNPSAPDFVENWQKLNQTVVEKLPTIMEQVPFGEFKAFNAIIPFLPVNSKIHLANSMAVRYGNFLGFKDESLEIICNRGTSGIDGSNSTAVGCVFTTKDPVTLITGDMAFFYDRNAFWHKYDMPNLRVLLLNNHGGGIFRIIDGPSALPEFEEFFETRQVLEAEDLARENHFEYVKVTHLPALKSQLNDFYKNSLRPKILEVVSESKSNTIVLKNVKTAIKKFMENKY